MTTITKAAVMISLPIARVNAANGCQHDASKRGEPDADRNHRRHHGSQRNTERAHYVRVLHSGAHDPAEGGPRSSHKPATASTAPRIRRR